MKKKIFLPLTFGFIAATIAIPLFSASCGFNMYQTPHNKDGIKTSKSEFEVLFGDNLNNYYVDFTNSKFAEDAKKNGLKNEVYDYELLKKYVTIPNLDKFAKNYAYKWYFKSTGPKSVEFYLYSVPIEVIAKKYPEWVAVDKEASGWWNKIKQGDKKLTFFKIQLTFDEE